MYHLYLRHRFAGEIRKCTCWDTIDYHMGWSYRSDEGYKYRWKIAINWQPNLLYHNVHLCKCSQEYVWVWFGSEGPGKIQTPDRELDSGAESLSDRVSVGFNRCIQSDRPSITTSASARAPIVLALTVKLCLSRALTRRFIIGTYLDWCHLIALFSLTAFL